MSERIDHVIDSRGYVLMGDSRGIVTPYEKRHEVWEWAQKNNIEIEYQGLKQNGNVIPAIKIDGKYLDRNEFNKLAQNDGFNSESDFFKWFHKDFKGKIINWTDLRY